MKNVGRIKKLAAMWLAVWALTIMWSLTAYGAIPLSEFNSRLDSLRSTYPNYSTWTGTYAGGSQCWGFARLVADNVFGGSWGNWPQVNSISGVKKGDIVQYGNTSGSGHTIFVTDVSGNTITFVDCNGNGNYSGGNKVRTCGIKWDNTITKGSSMFGKYSFSYLLSSPGVTSNNSPILFVDSAASSTGKITVSGWAYDPDNTGTAIPVHVYLIDANGGNHFIGGVSANQERQDVDNAYHCGSHHGFTGSFYTKDHGGRYTVAVAALDATEGGNGATWNTEKTINLSMDTTAPTITGVTVSNVTDSGYKVSATVKDNVVVNKMQMPTWYQSKNGLPDAQWYNASRSGDTYSYTVSRTSGQNTYYTDLYAWDYQENEASAKTVNVIYMTVSFNANGGSVGTASKSVANANFNNTAWFSRYGDLPTPTRTGHTFIGWFTAASGGSQVTKDNYVKEKANHTLFAHWSVNKYYLDVNGYLDGKDSGSLGSCGTFDIYVGGTLVGNDVADYYEEIPYNTSYEIKDIKAKTGYSYGGVHSGSLTGKMPAQKTVVSLTFTTNGYALDVNGYLDGKDSGSLGSYGTFDIYVGGTLVGNDVADYNGEIPYNTSYEIKDIKARNGYQYAGVHSGSLSGTLTGNTAVSLDFRRIYTILLDLNYTGKNYLVDSDFENLDSAFWHSRNTDVAVLSIDATEQHHGRHSLRIENMAAGENQKDLGIQSLANSAVVAGGLPEEKDMILSFWAKSSAAGTRMYFRWGYEDASGYRYVTLSTEWAKYTVTMEKRNSFGQYIHPYVDRAGTVWISEMQLEDGNNATVFEPEHSSEQAFRYYAYGSDYVLPEPAAREGYTFTGWSQSKSGTAVEYHAGDRITVSSSLALHAVWIEREPDFVLPAALTQIGEEAFAGGAFTYVVVPEGTTRIEKRAFADNKNLRKIVIPDSVEWISWDAFDGVDALTICGGGEGCYAYDYAMENGFAYKEQ